MAVVKARVDKRRRTGPAQLALIGALALGLTALAHHHEHAHAHGDHSEHVHTEHVHQLATGADPQLLDHDHHHGHGSDSPALVAWLPRSQALQLGQLLAAPVPLALATGYPEGESRTGAPSRAPPPTPQRHAITTVVLVI